MGYFTYASKSQISIQDMGTTQGTVDVYGVDSTIDWVTMDLEGFSHGRPDDVDMLLVGPDGQRNIAFMSDTGATTNSWFRDFGFSDAAMVGLGNTITDGGLYLPTDLGASETSGNWGLSIPTINHGGSFASAFGGASANGNWSLYIRDDQAGETGTLKGWDLTVHTQSTSTRLDGTADDDFIRILTSNQAADDGMFAVNERGAVGFRNVGTFYIHDGAGDDLLLLDREEDYVYAGAGRDTVHAGGGDDYFFLNAGADGTGDIYDGGAGVDLTFSSVYETLDLRDDTITDLEGFFMSGGGKLQVTAAQLASVTDVYGAFNPAITDTFEVTMGASDSVDLRTISFTYFDGAGDKVVVRGDGDSEFIEGSNVSDVVKAGGGNDHIKTNNGFDSVDGGKGNDMVDYSNRMVAVELKLNGSNEVGVKIDGIVEGSVKSVENVWGGFAGDLLKGDSLANLLDGRAGEDRLKGFGGNDRLEGGIGADTVWGGAGKDQFKFATPLDAVDHIRDFSHADDTIVLDNAVFAAFANVGAIKANKFVANASGHDAHTAKQKLIYDKADHSLWYDADGNGAGAAVEIAIFDNNINNLDFRDFLIV
jgi:hypothetical protein